MPIYAYSAQANQSMMDFATELQQQLSGDFAKHFDSQYLNFKDEFDKAQMLLTLLLAQKRNEDYSLTEPKMAQWIAAAQTLTQDGLLLLLTSRWQLPDWPTDDHRSLKRLSYQDFLRLAQSQDLPLWLLQQQGKMKTLHQTLHGNGRGLVFFTAAIKTMNQAQEQAFEDTLKDATEKLQANMALSTIVEHLDQNEFTLLCRMTAYASPVPIDGVLKLAMCDEADMAETVADKALQRLLQCSLIEQQYSLRLQCNEYFCSPIVADWLVQLDSLKGHPQKIAAVALPNFVYNLLRIISYFC